MRMMLEGAWSFVAPPSKGEPGTFAPGSPDHTAATAGLQVAEGGGEALRRLAHEPGAGGLAVVLRVLVVVGVHRVGAGGDLRPAQVLAVPVGQREVGAVVVDLLVVELGLSRGGLPMVPWTPPLPGSPETYQAWMPPPVQSSQPPLLWPSPPLPMGEAWYCCGL